MTRAQVVKLVAGLITTLFPWIEKMSSLLPLSPRVREDALPVAVISSLLCAIAGHFSAKKTGRGLLLGWVGLGVFLVSVAGILTPTVGTERPLYVVFFAAFSLSVASFLSV